MDIYSELHQIATVLLAAVLGGFIGLEREFAKKAAGLRTHVFVSAGSALLVVLSDSIVRRYTSAYDEHLSTDPIRIMQAIVVAISFLGAGTIVHERGGSIEGLTTAGSIYITAGVGIAVAVNEVILASGTVILAVVSLWCVGRIEKRFTHHQTTHNQTTLPSAEATPTGDAPNVRRAAP